MIAWALETRGSGRCDDDDLKALCFGGERASSRALAVLFAMVRGENRVIGESTLKDDLFVDSRTWDEMTFGEDKVGCRKWNL